MPNGIFGEALIRRQYEEYKARGGRLSFEAWLKAGRPLAFGETTTRGWMPQVEPEPTEAELWEQYPEGFPVSEFPEPPTEIPEGYHWEKIEYDPETPWVKLEEPYWFPTLAKEAKEEAPSLEYGMPETYTDESGYTWGIIRNPAGDIIDVKGIGYAPEEAGISPYDQWGMGFQERQLAQQMAREQARLQSEREERLINLTAQPRRWIDAHLLARAMAQAKPWTPQTTRTSEVLAGNMPYEYMTPEELSLHTAYQERIGGYSPERVAEWRYGEPVSYVEPERTWARQPWESQKTWTPRVADPYAQFRYEPSLWGAEPTTTLGELAFQPTPYETEYPGVQPFGIYPGAELAAYEDYNLPRQLGVGFVSPAEIAEAIAGASPTAEEEEYYPQYPFLPEELAEVMPWVTPGEMISPERPMKTPSGQLWYKMPWDVQEQALGLAEFTGRPAREVLGQMRIMAPKEPLGIGRKRWQPALQRA